MAKLNKTKKNVRNPIFFEIPKGFASWTDQQIDDWSAGIYGQLMSEQGANLPNDEMEEVRVDRPVYVIDAEYFTPWSLGMDHPTRGRRYAKVKEIFNELAAERGFAIVEVAPRVATYEELVRVHSPRHIIRVTQNNVRFSTDEADKQQAMLASAMVGATVQMLDALVQKQTLTAINFAGSKHHAQYDHSAGFCALNDFAVAATIATKDFGLRVAIFDIDAHHGDGTENLTIANPDVLTYSVHEYGIFPGSGGTSDENRLAFNKPLKAGDGDKELLQATNEFLDLTKTFKPDLVFLAVGADGHETDSLANLKYTVGGYMSVAKTLRMALPSMPMLIGGAGGYQPETFTPEIWAKFAIEIALGAKD
jgi:acetoin utilization protein AcuC